MLDGVRNGIGQHGILIRPRLFLEVLGDSCRNCVTRNFLGAFSGEQDEREIGKFVSNLFEKFDAITAGHIVIGDDAVERLLGEMVQTVAGAVRLHNLESIICTLEENADHLREVGLVIDVEDAERFRRSSCFGWGLLLTSERTLHILNRRAGGMRLAFSSEMYLYTII